MDMILRKRRFLIAGVLIVGDLLLMSLLASTAREHHVGTSPRTSNVSLAASYDSPNVVTDGLAMMMNDVSQTADTIGQRTLNGAVTVATVATDSGAFVEHDCQIGAVFVTRGVGESFAFAGRVVGGGFLFMGRAVIGSFVLVGHGIGSAFAFAGRSIGSIFGFASDVTHVSSVIRPADHTPAPTITQLRIAQAALIQKGTKDVSVAALTSGAGGACDAGDGNGGYPMKWCNAAMDSIATVSYSSDLINRECTSYAYWYFTSVEGHTGFRATGNAKYWASTSNYPTHAAPARGAIAVETVGAYGHVAIVQALPGQKYAGKVVPAGYVLVSEMNYDWNGHFRYSYSPLSKFSAYIYP
ncbi:MAG TPA: CHAP domain-containing protein [Candidatus Saccharimonadales bacterium]